MADINQTVEHAVLTTVERADPNQTRTRLALYTEDGRPFDVAEVLDRIERLESA